MRTIHNNLNFDNSEIAFRDKTNFELRQSYMLFKVLNSNTMVNISKYIVEFAFALHIPIKWIIRKTLYKHFVGGESIMDCKKTIEKLAERNVGTILDFAVEGEDQEELFDATCNEVIRTIEFAHNNKNVPFSAFKITGIGRFSLLGKISDEVDLTVDENDEFIRIHNRVDSIFKRGYELNVPILIDAEHSWIQPILDKMVLEMMEKYNRDTAIVRNTYQMYRNDSVRRLKEHHEISLEKGYKFGLKIVRGAYMEIERARSEAIGYPSPIHPDKIATDKDFDDIIRYFINNIDTIDFMVATHNEDSTHLLAELIEEYNLPKDHPSIYFSQLYGMSDHITFNLSENGYNVVKYIPYGKVKTMMPYLFRRAEENMSVRGQSSRELSMIESELRRRRM